MCAGLDKECLTEGAAIPAVVTSVEDHGYIVEFGIDGSTGFLSRDSAGDEHDSLLTGQLIEVVIALAQKRKRISITTRRRTEEGVNLARVTCIKSAQTRNGAQAQLRSKINRR